MSSRKVEFPRTSIKRTGKKIELKINYLTIGNDKLKKDKKSEKHQENLATTEIK